MGSTIRTSRRWMYWIAATAWLCATASWAQNYPVKPVRYVIPFPAGTGNDIVGRLLTDRLTRLWGQNGAVGPGPHFHFSSRQANPALLTTCLGVAP